MMMWKSLVKNDGHSLVKVSPPELESNSYQDPVIPTLNNPLSINAVGGSPAAAICNTPTTTFPSQLSPATMSAGSGVDGDETKSKIENPSINEQSFKARALESKTTQVTSYVYQLIIRVASTVKDLKQKYPDRPIILAGWGAAAAVNCQVASMEPILASSSSSSHSFITACVCLGFPFFTLEGSRGEPDDPLLDCRTPCFFVVGQQATQCKIDDLEDTRERMRVETGLLVVGGADDGLRISNEKKKLEGINQSMVDRCLMDEVRSFLVGSLLSSTPNRFVVPSGQQCDLPIYQSSGGISLQGQSSHLTPLIRGSINVGNLVVNTGVNNASLVAKRIGNVNGKYRKRNENKRSKQTSPSPNSSPLKSLPPSLANSPNTTMRLSLGNPGDTATTTFTNTDAGTDMVVTKARKMLDMSQNKVSISSSPEIQSHASIHGSSTITPTLPQIPTTVKIPTMMKQPMPIMPTVPLPQSTLRASSTALSSTKLGVQGRDVVTPPSSTAQLLASSPLLSSALTSPGGAAKSGQTQLIPPGSLSLPVVLTTASIKTGASPATTRYTSPQQLQTPIPAISLVSAIGTTNTTSQISTTANPRISPIGLVDNTGTSMGQQPHILQQFRAQQTAATQINQQRMVANTTQVAVSPHMVTRASPRLPDASGTIGIQTQQAPTLGGIRMTTRPLQQLPNLPTTSGIIFQQMGQQTITPSGTIISRPNQRLVIGSTAPLSSDSNNQQASLVNTSIATTIARYMQAETGAGSTLISRSKLDSSLISSISSPPGNTPLTATNLLAQTTTPVSSTHPHTLMLRRGGAPSSANQTITTPGGPKENLYIVAIPSSEQHRLLQVPSNSSTAAGLNTQKSQIILNANPNLQQQRHTITSGNVLKQALAGGHISGTSSPTQVERRNVAEILASLSGFMPEPPGNNPGINSTPPTVNVVSTLGSSLQVIPSSSKAKSTTPSPAPVSRSNLVIEAIKPTTSTDTKTSVSSLASTPSSGITITAFKSKPPPVLSGASLSGKTTIITSTKTPGIHTSGTIMTSSQSLPSPSVASTPATRVVRVLQSSAGSSGRQIIHQSSGSSLSIASSSSSPSPVVIARKSTVTPTSVLATTTVSTATVTSSSISSSGQARSRKQVLIPVDMLPRLEEQETQSDKKKLKESHSKSTDDDKDDEGSDDDSSVAKRIKRRRISSTSGAVVDSEKLDESLSAQHEAKKATSANESISNQSTVKALVDSEILASTDFEQDILEEDLDDLEYVPYTSRKTRNKKGSSSNKPKSTK